MTESKLEFERYSRQIRFSQIGVEGQTKLASSKVLLVGCGALGSFIANVLARSGVGHLVIADRDFLEISNLQRQVLFDEQDIELGLPKAIAAANKIKKINSQIAVTPCVTDIDFRNIEQLGSDVDLIVDGTDNFETRFLINDLSGKLGIPWIYGGCLGASGQSMTIIPGTTACLHCLMTDGPPPPGTSPTCDLAGIIAPIIGTIASVQSSEAIKVLIGKHSGESKLLIVDLWEQHIRYLDLTSLKHSNRCQVCHEKNFQWLEGKKSSFSAVLCGRNSVQLSFQDQKPVNLKVLADKLQSVGEVTLNDFMLRFGSGDYTITLFPDGRAIISGTNNIARAKSIYAQYVGA